METIQEVIQKLHSSLREYIEATYHISSPQLLAQRKKLLDKCGVIHQAPYIESTARYALGGRFEDIPNLSPAALEIYHILSKSDAIQKNVLHNPPYRHQYEAIFNTLVNNKNLLIMTGTGSGKTESFLMPILGKLAHEAKNNPKEFNEHIAMRAMILYPMNALVNDQLGRLRAILGDARTSEKFKNWAGRPVRFARYTSRTPYAGVRTSLKDSTKLKSYGEFYVEIVQKAEEGDSQESKDAKHLLNVLKERGKWPAKPDIQSWFGKKGNPWKDSSTGKFIRAKTLINDSELLTRHEVQENPPDVLVTNYSMLEYMLMRPIEQSIFDSSKKWLEKNPKEKFLIVLDEAHLYRGAAGAEVGLLLRRLRDRLGIPVDRFQIICATASFNDPEYAKDFGGQLSGTSKENFESIVGHLNPAIPAIRGNQKDAEILSEINLSDYYSTNTDKDKIKILKPLLSYLNVSQEGKPEVALYEAFKNYGPMGLLINETMTATLPIAELGTKIFETDIPTHIADKAVTVLMALGSIARLENKNAGLLPCRIHNFFRGLPGLWVCMNADCTELHDDEKSGICGKMYAQPHERCACGSPILEFYTCRNCGSAYARAYTDDIDSPSTLWSKPGKWLRMSSGETVPLLPIDLLLEKPSPSEFVEPVIYNLLSGRLGSKVASSHERTVYIKSMMPQVIADDDEEAEEDPIKRGLFIPCGICNTDARYGRSSVQDHQTKGDEPFQVLVTQQIRLQPPGPMPATRFAPLQGRKVLAFSDSRQVAARLAPKIQNYSMRDALRPLIAAGYSFLKNSEKLKLNISLEDLYLAVLIAAKRAEVRLRPELIQGENFYEAERVVEKSVLDGSINTELGLQSIWMDFKNETPPMSLLEDIILCLRDRFLGFEALAIASLVEREKHTSTLQNLPVIQGIAETAEEKLGLVRFWLRCWQKKGFWLNSMPHAWYLRPSSEGLTIGGQKDIKFQKKMSTILKDKKSQKIFKDEWLPVLTTIFTHDTGSGLRRLRGSELSLNFEGNWVRCPTCKSVYPEFLHISYCLDCEQEGIVKLNPDLDPAFEARKGFYRNPIISALRDPSYKPMALIAAEHTAQLNAPQSDDIFSKAEENELLFQDIALTSNLSNKEMAIDVLSSTTTMEVGIDLGSLSGVALRNMPPGRANYQQRAGRAGRRGNAVATVVAFGSADSHDEHYFSQPEFMIKGTVVDPKLTLDNVEIVRRHIRAFLLQRYHRYKLPMVSSSQNHDLFSVLGTVTEFRDKNSILNRDDFYAWLQSNHEDLKKQIIGWIPQELSEENKSDLLQNLIIDCLKAIDEAIRPGPGETKADAAEGEIENAEIAEEVDNRDVQGRRPGKLLDRLLYCGKLPRYAFPTDVATFNVFDIGRSSGYRHVMSYSPSQSLPIALSQYAPGKQVWIAGKCYTSGAIYSPIPDERFQTWSNKKIYSECKNCGFAKTFEDLTIKPGDIGDCIACGGVETFGPARNWIRPPGFAHPVDVQETTSSGEISETSYATRAKLTLGTEENDLWFKISERIRALKLRTHLLVSNSGPEKQGYNYCLKCGRIEATSHSTGTLNSPHRKPFPDDDILCEGLSPTRNLVLGTDFITDIALFSLKVEKPIFLRPGHDATNIALRTLSEALAKAACRLLEIEPSEIMAEYRPALTPGGASGLEVEIFMYDTLPGGAGFSTQLVDQGNKLFELALNLIKNCSEGCDASCYRCLRNFRNKIEHSLLDRHTAIELLEYVLYEKWPSFSPERIKFSTEVLYNDLLRMGAENFKFEYEITLDTKIGKILAPIYAEDNVGNKFIICLSGPLTPEHPSDSNIQNLRNVSDIFVIVENELLVRNNLPAATNSILKKLGLK